MDTNDKRARDFFFAMLRIRMIEEAIAAHYPEQEMRCPVHLCIGQEAIAVGVCAALGPDDYVLSGHRSHGHYLAKGGNFKAMMGELYGRASGCCGGKGGSMHLVDLGVGFLGATPIVGSTIPIAVGAAFTAQLKGEPRVAVTFFGEGATEEGVFHEALNFAALRNLPVVFVCENNLYSVYSPMNVRQPPDRDLATIAAGHGVGSSKGDGNDVIHVYERASEAVIRAREGDGPTLLEFTTYRWREHCGPNYDNDLGYRSHQEFEAWKARCPIRRLEEHLRQHGLLSDGELVQMEEVIRAEIDAAFTFARQSPFPSGDRLLDDVYAD